MCRLWHRSRLRCARAQSFDRWYRNGAPRPPSYRQVRTSAPTTSGTHRVCNLTELLGDEIIDETTNVIVGNLLGDLVQKTADTQTLSDISRNAAAFQVIELLFVDWTDGRRMTTPHIVLFYLEIGNRICVCTLGNNRSEEGRVG